jgi:RsmE family RNA methyltransferase
LKNILPFFSDTHYQLYLTKTYSPEGGWTEPYEIDMFRSKGFQQITLGTRVLRSDVAVVSLLSLANEVCSE